MDGTAAILYVMMLAKGETARTGTLALIGAQLGWTGARAEEPGEASPAATPPPSVAPARVATVWFVPAAPSNRPTFFVEIDARGHLAPAPASPARRAMIEPWRFEPLCVGACSVQLPHGTYSIALGRPGGNATAMAALSVTRDTRVVGHYHSARWRRVLGTTVIATSASVGSLLILAGTMPLACPSDGLHAHGCPAPFLVGRRGGRIDLANDATVVGLALGFGEVEQAGQRRQLEGCVPRTWERPRWLLDGFHHETTGWVCDQ
jgi:hypothetical protein